MNVAMKNFENLYVPKKIIIGVERCHRMADLTNKWCEKHPCPTPDGAKFPSEADCAKWWDNHFAKLLNFIIEHNVIDDKVVYAYLKCCYVWTGERHGFQFFYPQYRQVYVKYLCI